MKRCSLQDVFVEGFEAYARGRELHWREREAARCITQCYTSALGAHLQVCPQGDYRHVQYHACRHRSCPRCAKDAQQAWVNAQLKRLLPCPHGHVIFTLPHQLLPLWEFNRSWFTGVLFDSARQALLQLMRDPARLGATPGIVMSLHTWGRDLSHHPHLHCLVTAGGVDEKGQWRAVRGKWVVPLKPLLQLYRGKMLAALIGAVEQGRLQLPPWTSQQQWREDLGRQYQQQWSAKVCPVYSRGRGVMLYLARYAKGGPLNAKLLQMDEHQVRLRYEDHRSKKRRWLTLELQDFIARVLWHAPPRGAHTMRHAGLYSTPYREQHAQALAQLSGSAQAEPAEKAECTDTAQETPPEKPPTPSKRCPRCGGPLLRQLLLSPKPRRSSWAWAGRGNSIPSPAPAVRATGPPRREPASPLATERRQTASGLQRCPTGRSS